MAVLLGLWVFLPQQPGMPPSWLCQLCIALAAGMGVLALVSPEVPGRRWHLGCTLLLLVTASELQFSGWLLLPTKPGGNELAALLREQALTLASLRWVAGVPGWPGPFWWLVLPFVAITLIAQSTQQVLHRGMRRLAGFGAWVVLLALMLRLGYFFVQPDGQSAPSWPLAAALVAGITALALAVTAVCWVYWWCRLPAIGAQQQALQAEVDARAASAAAARAAAPPPTAADLQARLDALAAQEGADKYTRE